MPNTVNIMSQWIPIVGTLLGAGIGFVASFFNTKFNKDKEEQLSRESKDRHRVEKIYQLLVAINSEKSSEVAGALSSIHNTRPIVKKDIQAFHPLLELEMLINLYFPGLEGQRQVLMESIQAFGTKYIDYGFKDYRKESLKIKQHDSGVLVKLHLGIDSEIKKMQKLLVEHVKA